ncbi:MAG: hypothetical protein J5825_01210 [Lachnospiraceae bacterium]|nr:hypothetical protein [Lachnospiraceae bacterium]
MGQCILCPTELAEHPFVIRELGLHIYSGEELCYYIYHNLALIDDSFISSELLHFIEVELGMKDTVVKLRNMIDPPTGSKATLNQVLTQIMWEMKYYNEEELEVFARSLEEYRRMTESDRVLARADALLERKKYYAAISVYEDYFRNAGSRNIGPEALERAWQHLAVVYLRIYYFKDAADCLVKAYEQRTNEAILKQLYFLSIQKDVDLPADFFTVESPEVLSKWQEEYRSLFAATEEAMENSRIRRAMKKDSVRREQELRSILEDLKKEYRMSE